MDYLKQKIGIENDVYQHLESLEDLDYLKSSCKKMDKVFPPNSNHAKIIKSNNGFKPDFELVTMNGTVKLQTVFEGSIIEDNNFCVGEDWKGNIVTKACTLPCLGIKPCLR